MIFHLVQYLFGQGQETLYGLRIACFRAFQALQITALSSGQPIGKNLRQQGGKPFLKSGKIEQLFSFNFYQALVVGSVLVQLRRAFFLPPSAELPDLDVGILFRQVEIRSENR